jgi:hypothetical protein
MGFGFDVNTAIVNRRLTPFHDRGSALLARNTGFA